MAIQITLGNNLQTTARLEGHTAAVKTAYFDPREDMQPGELLASALGACMLTMVGYAAQKRGEDVSGTQLTVEPIFGGTPRRVTEIKLTFAYPANFTQAQKDLYTKTAQTCPVHNSLREDIRYTIEVK